MNETFNDRYISKIDLNGQNLSYTISILFFMNVPNDVRNTRENMLHDSLSRFC